MIGTIACEWSAIGKNNKLPRKACHTWDTIGAHAAGWEAGLIQRVNNDILDTAAQPQYVGKDLNAIPDQIIARHGHG